MMLASHGNNMPCFKAGNQTIIDLENRLNPPGVNTNK